jgi:hypothetical protein
MNEANNLTAPPRPAHQHESRDADLRKLTYLALGILALIIFGFVITEITFYIFVGRQQVPAPQAFFSPATQMPPAPRVQQNPRLDLGAYMQEENEVLDTYGWVDRKAGIVRVPVDRAMTLLLQQGLKVRKPGQTTTAPSVPHEVPRGDFAPPPKPLTPGPRNQ